MDLHQPTRYRSSPCETCPHTYNWHADTGACDVPGCPCDRFVDAVDEATATDDEVRVRRASFHVVTGDEAFVREALAGHMGDTAQLAAQTATGDAMARDYLEDSARIATGLYVLLQMAEVIDAADSP